MSFFGKLFQRERHTLDNSRIPVHIAIIPDGNGRWAKKRGLPRSAGHREGSMALKNIVKYCAKLGVQYMTVFTFSTENWKRPKTEVDALMALLLEFLRNAEKELAGSNVRIRVIGDIKTLPEEFHREIPRVEQMTQKNKGLCLNIALNYGGRDEILHAVAEIARDVSQGRLKLQEIDSRALADRLYTKGIPDPDLLIRTSGEKRASNFLLWQLAYTEFWYTDILWPDIREQHIVDAIFEFQNRNRRFGGV
jgi:undecaprenyl diphosphate synthase